MQSRFEEYLIDLCAPTLAGIKVGSLFLYITEEDERDLRFKRIKSANQSAKRRIDFIRKYYNDEGGVTETKEDADNLLNSLYSKEVQDSLGIKVQKLTIGIINE